MTGSGRMRHHLRSQRGAVLSSACPLALAYPFLLPCTSDSAWEIVSPLSSSRSGSRNALYGGGGGSCFFHDANSLLSWAGFLVLADLCGVPARGHLLICLQLKSGDGELAGTSRGLYACARYRRWKALTSQPVLTVSYQQCGLWDK